MIHYLILHKPLEKTIDRDGNYTIVLSSNLQLKGTREEIQRLIANLQRMIS